MKPKFIAAVMAGLFVALLIAACGQEVRVVRLAYKFKPGQKRAYSNIIKNSSRFYEGKTLARSSDLAYRSALTEEVLSTVDSSSARIRLTDISVRPNPNKSDSLAPDSITHRWSLEYLMNSDGRIVEIFPQNPHGEEWLEYYKNYYEQALPVLPQTEISPGYIWSQTVKLITRDEGSTKVETTYRLRALAREAGYNCAVIEYDGALNLPYQKSEKSGATTERLDKAKTKGVIYFAYREGMIIRQEESYEIESVGTRTSGGSTVSFKTLSKRNSSMVLTERSN